MLLLLLLVRPERVFAPLLVPEARVEVGGGEGGVVLVGGQPGGALGPVGGVGGRDCVGGVEGEGEGSGFADQEGALGFGFGGEAGRGFVVLRGSLCLGAAFLQFLFLSVEILHVLYVDFFRGLSSGVDFIHFMFPGVEFLELKLPECLFLGLTSELLSVQFLRSCFRVARTLKGS